MHFFQDGSGPAPLNFFNVRVDEVVQVGIWGARVGERWATPSINDPSVAKIVGAPPTKLPDGTLRKVTIKAIREGNVMLEAKVGDAVWAFA